jgi:hypothetical protein
LSIRREFCGGGLSWILVVAHLVKQWGNSSANSIELFATLELMEQVKGPKWLANVTNVLNEHWQRKNTAKQNRLPKRLAESSTFCEHLEL